MRNKTVRTGRFLWSFFVSRRRREKKVFLLDVLEADVIYDDEDIPLHLKNDKINL